MSLIHTMTRELSASILADERVMVEFVLEPGSEPVRTFTLRKELNETIERLRRGYSRYYATEYMVRPHDVRIVDSINRNRLAKLIL